MKFLKGHGTENDFVILTDWPAHHPLTGEVIRRLCDRRAGIGGDGLICVATAGELLDAGVLGALPAGVAREYWFMDYYNADGSTAEMCGNGMRVFAHTLLVLGKVNQDSFVVGSRAGVLAVGEAGLEVGGGRIGQLVGDGVGAGILHGRPGEELRDEFTHPPLRGALWEAPTLHAEHQEQSDEAVAAVVPGRAERSGGHGRTLLGGVHHAMAETSARISSHSSPVSPLRNQL